MRRRAAELPDQPGPDQPDRPVRPRPAAEEGFIHASTAQQVAGVANKFYRGDSGLVLLEIDTDLVGPQVRYELVPGAADPFPHIYGPLNTTAVVAVTPFTRRRPILRIC